MSLVSSSTLRERLDRLAVGTPAKPSFWDKLAYRADAPLPDTQSLLTLDHELERAGIHTLADARLLGRLARGDHRAHALHEGLQRRTRQATEELIRLLETLERHQRLTGQTSPTQLERAEDLFVRLVRALEVARFLGEPREGSTDEIYRPFPRSPAAPEPPTTPALAAVEFFFQRTREQALDLRRKRRHLDRAHELLLSLSSELGKDRARAHSLRTQVADERHRLASLERIVNPHETIPQAVRRAFDHGQGQAAYRGLLAVYRGAIESGQGDLAAGSRAALDSLWGRLGEVPEAAITQDAQRRLAEKLGEGALGRLWTQRATTAQRDALLEAAYGITPEQWSVYDLAVSAGEFFDTGETEEVEEGDGAMAPSREPSQRVPYPTADMSFETAKDLRELTNFVISDPRLVLYDLASGTQLVRAYYEQPERKPKKTRRSAVRVYVCDASGSMRGHRARFRDALLVAELNNLSIRAQKAKEFWPIYYCFFNDQPMPLRRVDSAVTAYDAIAELFEHSPARGRTDITYALESAFGAIREARGHDPDLARATVVLLTDGEDQIDVPRIEAARHPVGDIEITLNFISLGDGNADLRRLVLEQRQSGKRAFYSHLSDPELEAGASLGGSELRTLLPELPELALTADEPTIRAAIDALEKIAQGANVLPEGPPPSSRFEAYFPAEIEARPGRASASDRERVLDLVGAVAEAVALAAPAERPSEAVELVEHLLQLYSFDLTRYRVALQGRDPELLKAVQRVRLIAGSFRVPHLAPAETGPRPDPAAKVVTQPILPVAGRGA